MRPSLLSLFFLSFLASTICQPQTISLKDGSTLHGIFEPASADSLVKIRLSDSVIIEIPKALVGQVSPKKKKEYWLLNGGSKILSRGKYFALGVHTLTAEKFSNDFGEKEMRWGMGCHFSFGYQINPAIALGGGFGLDVPEEVFTPIFLEARGVFLRKPGGVKKGNAVRWFGSEVQYYPKPFEPVAAYSHDQKVALCYGLQAGFYFPWNEVFNEDDFVKTTAGLLIYPALGLAFPSTGGSTFLFDFGYKFQRHTVTSVPTFSPFTVIETVHLNSFAIRAGWTF